MPQNACGCDHARRGADKRAEHIGIAASELAHEEGRWQRAQRKAEIEQADGQRDEGGIGRQFLADQATQRNHDGRAGGAKRLCNRQDNNIAPCGRHVGHRQPLKGRNRDGFIGKRFRQQNYSTGPQNYS